MFDERYVSVLLDLMQVLLYRQVNFFLISQQSKECPRERKIIDIS